MFCCPCMLNIWSQCLKALVFISSSERQGSASILAADTSTAECDDRKVSSIRTPRTAFVRSPLASSVPPCRPQLAHAGCNLRLRQNDLNRCHGLPGLTIASSALESTENRPSVRFSSPFILCVLLSVSKMSVSCQQKTHRLSHAFIGPRCVRECARPCISFV